MSKTRLEINDSANESKKRKPDAENYLRITLQKSGLTLKTPPDKNIAILESVIISRNLKKQLESHYNYPTNLDNLFECFQSDCKDIEIFKHYLFPNIVRRNEESSTEYLINDSVIKILLNIPNLQEKIIKYIFDKAIDFAVEGKCAPWIKMILKNLTALEKVKMSSLTEQLINLMQLATEKIVRLEILTSIPFIMGDQYHEVISFEIIQLLNEDQELIPAVLDCLSHLSLSDEQYLSLNVKILSILRTLTKYMYFPCFVKYLLIPGRMNEVECIEIVQGLRSALDWPTSNTDSSEINTSQVLTALALRCSMISSKVIATAWLKELSNVKISTDCKSIDFIFLLLLYTISEDKQNAVERLIRKQVKLEIIKEDLLKDVFVKYKPILKEYLHNLIELNNSLLITHTDSVLVAFASHIYMLMVEELQDHRPRILAELLQLGLDRKQCILSILQILNDIVTKDKYMLKDHSIQMLILLDRMDDLSINEQRYILNLVCGLAYNCSQSIIRDDVHIIMTKQLSSCNPAVKIQGILAGVHAIKYLMLSNIENSQEAVSDNSEETILLQGSAKDAAQIIELIACSTKQFPDITAFYYDELCAVITKERFIDKQFINWLLKAVTNDLENNFIVRVNEMEREINNIKIYSLYCLNSEDDTDGSLAINIAELSLSPKADVHIGILCPLFTLVQTLHDKCGKISDIEILLGCGIVMPDFDMDTIDNLELKLIHNILDCLIHCVNWFRELLNAFSSSTVNFMISQRISQIVDIENHIAQILVKSGGNYKSPNSFSINKYIKGTVDKPQMIIQKNKVSHAENIVSQDITKTQNVTLLKNKSTNLPNLPFRSLDMNIMILFDYGITLNEFNNVLNVKVFLYLTKHVINILEKYLPSRVKRNTFLGKEFNIYDHSKAEHCAKMFSTILPKIITHLKIICDNLDEKLIGKDNEMFPLELSSSLSCLEQLYNMLCTYFKWHGFKTSHSLLKSSLRTIVSDKENVGTLGLNELLLYVTKFLLTHKKYCIQVSTAISLFDLLKVLQEISNNMIILKMLRDFSSELLIVEWKGSDGVLEKGLFYNQCLDKISLLYFSNNDIIEFKKILDQIKHEVKELKKSNDVLPSLKSFHKGNFSILYRNLGTATFDIVKNKTNKTLKNSENLELWIDIVDILEDLLEIVKCVENRYNLSTIFKKSLLILNLFNTRAIPVIKKMFKTSNNEILCMFKKLQKTTRFLQSLCYHSRVKKDSALMAKVPSMKQTLENLIYKVKAILAANDCSQAFWIGNLKTKTIHGEVVNSQESVDESVEDSEEVLPYEDDDCLLPEETDEDIINPDFGSSLDIA